MESEKFKEWEKKRDDESEDWSWNDLDDRSILDILDYCNMFG
jgi:hypothetical protein